MAEQSIFDLTWARQDQWGGEWHGLGGRFRIALQMVEQQLQRYALPPVDDMALDEWRAWMTDRLLPLIQQHQPEHVATVTDLIVNLRDIRQRPVEPQQLQKLLYWAQLAQLDESMQTRLTSTQALFNHLLVTHFDTQQLQHLRGLFRAQSELALAFHGLFGNGDLQRMETDPAAPLIHVNATLMAKCATDFRLAEQAVQQRQRLDQGNDQSWITWEGHMLYLADLMAYSCLEPLKNAGILPSDTAAVTYFQQSTEIRLIPYYNLMLIGLPSWVQNLYDAPPSAFLVIPHEVGHSLYRFGTLRRADKPPCRVHEALSAELAELGIDKTDWRSLWMEELFADAFGCLIAGPVSVLGIQEYLASGVPEHFLEAGAEHPTAAIRPLLQTEMLRIIDERGIAVYQTIPKVLDDHWQTFLDNNCSDYLHGNNVAAMALALPGQAEEITGQTMLTDVRPVLNLILDLLLELFASQQALTNWQPWSTDIAIDGGSTTDHLAILQQQFQQFYCRDGHLLRNIEPPTPMESYQPSALHERIASIAARIQSDQPLTTIPIEEWHQIFNMADWTDEGGKAGHIPQ